MKDRNARGTRPDDGPRSTLSGLPGCHEQLRQMRWSRDSAVARRWSARVDAERRGEARCGAVPRTTWSRRGRDELIGAHAATRSRRSSAGGKVGRSPSPSFRCSELESKKCPCIQLCRLRCECITPVVRPRRSAASQQHNHILRPAPLKVSTRGLHSSRNWHEQSAHSPNVCWCKFDNSNVHAGSGRIPRTEISTLLAGMNYPHSIPDAGLITQMSMHEAVRIQRGIR
jgi:hypothetical protein